MAAAEWPIAGGHWLVVARRRVALAGRPLTDGLLAGGPSEPGPHWVCVTVDGDHGGMQVMPGCRRFACCRCLSHGR